MSDKKRVYIAGPMRGYVHYNFPAFDFAKATLIDRGYDVVSPADLDRDKEGFEPMTLDNRHDWTREPADFDLKACIKRDIEALMTCDAVYMLRGWGDSVGAKAEEAIARWLGLDVMFEA